MPSTSSRVRASFHVLVALVVAAVVAACATNPVTGKREFTLMSEAQEIQIGQDLDQEVRREMGVYDDRELQAYVEDIGLRMARASHRPDLPWRFAVVDVAAVNAFALPGGYIYLTRGILAHLNDEAELAGVLGHEIGHVTARHAAQQYTRATTAGLGLALGGIFVPATRPFSGLAETGLSLLFLKYGRDDELQSDRLGAEYAARTGWDPGGVPDLLTTLSRIDDVSDRRGIPSWLSTHPEPGARVDEIRPDVEKLRAQSEAELRVNREGFLRRIDGMVYGDDPREGVVRGDRFLHPELRFAVDFPDGWEVTNSPTQVVARLPGEDVYMVLQLVRNARGRTIEEVAARAMREAGFRQIEGQRTRIHGLDAYVGVYEGQVQDLGRVLTRAAHIAHDRRVYVLAGLTRREAFPQVDGTVAESIGTFRPLSADEAAGIRPNRVDRYLVRSGDTWQRIAERAGEGIVRAAALAIMNGYPPNEQPRAGDRIKIVVAG